MRVNNLQDFFHDCRLRVDQQLQRAIHDQFQSEKPLLAEQFYNASLYSLTNGGKRLRPALVYASALAINPKTDLIMLDEIAAAIEVMHCYSLVHDDLPAMDNDDLRRGKPTCHIAFDEATAILVGDGFQSLSFDMLAHCEAVSIERRLNMIQVLTKATGNQGMVLGQALDLYAENKNIDLEQLAYIHEKKTGALIRASVNLGAIAAHANELELQALDNYARCIGLAFQIQDDILDIESETAVLGKKQGADRALNKSTYPALMGLERAKEKAATLINDANDATDGVLPHPYLLSSIANFIIERKY